MPAGRSDARTVRLLGDGQSAFGYCDATPFARRVERVTNSDITSVGITYFAGRSRTGDDAHIAAALTTEVATQLLSARVRTTAANGRAVGTRLLTVKLSDGGGFAEVDLAMTGSVFRDGDILRTQVRVTRTRDGTIVWSGTKVRPLDGAADARTAGRAGGRRPHWRPAHVAGATCCATAIGGRL